MSKFKVGQFVEVDSAEYQGRGRVEKVDDSTEPHGFFVRWNGEDGTYFIEDELEAVE